MQKKNPPKNQDGFHIVMRKDQRPNAKYLGDKQDVQQENIGRKAALAG